MTWLLLIIGFMFLAALLLLGLIYGRLHWALKAGLIATSLLFCGLFYTGLISALGYPASVQPPEVFEFIGAQVREPTKDTGGAVYIWLLGPGSEVPRAVEIPYSGANRHMAAAAKQQIQNGARVYMRLRPSEQQNVGTGNGGATASSPGHGHGMSGDKLYDVHGTPTLEIATPPDTLPRKEGS